MAIIFRIPKINLSLQLLTILGAALLFGNYLPANIQSFLYALSLSLKGILLFVLPAVIFSCLFSCLLSFQGGKAVGLMLLLFLLVCLSNYVSTLIAYGVGSLKLIQLDTLNTAINSNQELLPLWEINLPNWLSNKAALFLGFGLGAIFSFFPSKKAYQFSQYAKDGVTLFLEKCFIPVLPLFALGFILKMQYDGILYEIIRSYLPLLLLIVVTFISYLLFLFALAAGFDFKQWLIYLKNTLPVALMGFSTMSSLATMPVTLKAAEKNTGNTDLARAIIPATVNIHLIGVSISIPLMALAILTSFGFSTPSFTEYSVFALYFVLTQFSVAAVPGGGILIMIPLLESHLGFTSEMSALITALYILFDPAVTITNVLGNSSLVIMLSKLFNRIISKPVIEQPQT